MSFRSLLVLTFALVAVAAAEEETEDGMAQMFAEMDTDKDGSLSLAEYSGLSNEEDHGMSPEELADTRREQKLSFDKLDEDKNGKLSQAELAKEMEEPPAPEDDEMSAMEEGAEEQDMEGTEGDEAVDVKHMAQQVMEDLDKDKDGFVSLKEFEGENLDGAEELDEETKKEVLKEFQNADKNNDSKLSAEEILAFTNGDTQPSEEA